MLRVSADTGPRKLDLPMGVAFTVLPARSDLVIDALGDLKDRDLEVGVLAGASRVTFAKALARRAIVAWEGVVDEATGKPAPVEPTFIDAVLDDWQIFGAFERDYVLPLWELTQEKNGSRSSSTGGSAGGKATATAAKGGARNARSGSTRRKAPKAG